MTGPTPPLGDAAGWRAFTASVTALVGTRDPLEVQAELADALHAAVAGVRADRLRTPEAPGKWSVVEVLEHLADMEAVFGYRLRQVLTADAPRLESVDQDAWAVRGDYAASDPTAALALLALSRARMPDAASHPATTRDPRSNLHSFHGASRCRRSSHSCRCRSTATSPTITTAWPRCSTGTSPRGTSRSRPEDRTP